MYRKINWKTLFYMAGFIACSTSFAESAARNASEYPAHDTDKVGAADKASDVVKKASEVADKAASDAMEKASDAADKASDAMEKAPDAADKASDAVKKATDAAKKAASDAMEKAPDAADKASDAVKKASEAADKAASDAMEKAPDAADKASDAVKKIPDAAKKAASDAMEKAPDAADKASDAVKKVPDAANKAASDVVEKATEAADKASDAVKKVPDAAKKAASDVVEKATEAADKASDAVKKVPDAANKAASDVVEKATEAADKASDAVKKVPDAAKKAASDVVKKATDTADKAASDAVKKISDVSAHQGIILENQQALFKDYDLDKLLHKIRMVLEHNNLKNVNKQFHRLFDKKDSSVYSCSVESAALDEKSQTEKEEMVQQLSVDNQTNVADVKDHDVKETEEILKKVHDVSAHIEAHQSDTLSSSKALYKEGYDFIRSANYVGAEKSFCAFQNRYKKDPLSDDALFWLAESLLGQKRYHEAAQVYLTAWYADKKKLYTSEILLKLARSMVALETNEEDCALFAKNKKRHQMLESVFCKPAK
ncbi:tol-pal system protein [Bartonella sp. AU16XJBT]|uniref:tol-pal system protein n=1 Tax=Bartonella sp. AU16XJBT TaxID=3019088 RepID=UPI00235E4E82|nr:tol-pal system protein [Bartonella sp. AU16XJBT]